LSVLSLIAAMSRNRVIGVNNTLPWNIPEDLKRFRQITVDHPIIMGRKTFASIGRPLPKRTNIVISRDRDLKFEGVKVVGSLEEAVQLASDPQTPGSEEAFVIGGGEIYRQALERSDRIYLTLIGQDFKGDAYFPEFDWKAFREVSREKRSEPLPFEFLVLDRDRKLQTIK
jgi:dihydrofolate reductase